MGGISLQVRNFTGRRAALAVGVALVALAAVPAPAGAQNNVTTAGYSTLRDNWDPAEPALGPSQIQSGTFGKVFETKLEGSIYSQPLAYEGNVIVTTEKANAYAVNAGTGAVVWKRSFGVPFTASAIRCSDLTPNLGSTSTPVIDPATGTVYLTTRLFEEGKKGIRFGAWYLQAVSAATGEERPGFPVKISGTPYNTPGVPFNEHYAQQRPALLLLGGVVYLAFASDCDITPYRGVVVGVNASSGAITTMWSDESGVGTDESSEAGVWQGGGGLVSTGPGRIDLATGNGVSPTRAPSGSPPSTLSESVVGLQVEGSGRIAPAQFFSPSNAAELDAADADLGSGGPIALPTEYFGTKAIPQLIVQVGKDGRIFLLNASNMGGFREGPGEGDAVVQTVGPYGGVWGHPAAYGGQGGWVYVLESAGGGYLRALSYGLSGGRPALTSAATSAESFGYTSGSPLVTSNGTTAGSPVVWVVYLSGPGGGKAQLRAYSGTPEGGVLPLLWSAKIGTGSKFATPTAYGGRVYVGNRSGVVFGFGATAAAPLQSPPVQLGSVPVGSTKTAEVTLAATTDLTVTAPASATGEQELAEPAGTQASARVTGPTAGKRKIPPSGVAVLPRGAITVQQPPVGTAVAAGARLHLRVRFRPTHAGPIVGEVTVHTSAGDRAVTLTAYATRPGLLVSAQPLAFGTVRTGPGGRSLALTVSNSGGHPERLTGFTLPGGPFRVSGLPRPGTLLAPRQGLTVAVRFDPAKVGAYHSRLAIRTDSGSITLPVSGSAVRGRPHLSLAPGHIDFGAVRVGTTATRTFTVGDSGDVPVEVTRVIGPEAPFGSPVALPAGITLHPGLQAHVTVSFTPLAPGRAEGVYLINSTDGRGYRRVQLTGTGY